MSRWFKGAVKTQPPMLAETEEAHLEAVELALIQLLNDDILSADKILKNANSSYHHLGRGISSYIASMLGAEKEMLKDAANILLEAENKAWEDMKRAQIEPKAFRSQVYAPGTEYLLCYAVAELTGAICAVLSGSVLGAINGFTKLRKAYLTLDGILEEEAVYVREKKASRRRSVASGPVASASHGPVPASRQGPTLDVQTSRDKLTLEQTPAEVGNEDIDLPNVEKLSLNSAKRVDSTLLEIDPASVGITSRTDVFIHSGTRLCFGILLVVFSMIESPIFNKILYIIGFKGDRQRGMHYLWQSSCFSNFNSALAGIAILGYYNGLIGFCDILPTDLGANEDLSGYPIAKMRILLADMRGRYPDSKLWKLEEARMYAYSRNLTAAVKIMAENSNSNMKQIATINMFEMGLGTLFSHSYELMAKCWIRCAELSNWSPSLYAFMSATSYLELYRNLREPDPTAAASYKVMATEYFRKAPPLAGRQKVMSKQLPFDMYIVRKCQKWEERAKEWGVDFADAIGVSPLAEMIYFWGGMKKENLEELQQTMRICSWERSGQPEKHKADLDETAIHAVIEACALRNLGEYDRARDILETRILLHNGQDFKGHLKDDWTCPSAHYEMACLAWREKDLEGMDHAAKVLECEQWLEKTQKWPDQYILDTRMSMKVTTSIATLKRHRKVTEV